MCCICTTQLFLVDVKCLHLTQAICACQCRVGAVLLKCSKLPSFLIFKNLTAVKRVPLSVMVALRIDFYPKADVFQKN